MLFPDDASIHRLARRVIDRSLPKSEWTHAGHFAAALWLLRHRRDLTHPDQIRRLIMSYNEATNTPNTDTAGYHHTITLASLGAARGLLDRLGSEAPLHLALRTLMTSDLGHRDWLLAYWTPETLFSTQARRTWVDADRAPFPF